ncbi:MAG: hypothetical protein RL199_1976 [Pseudomonadota bacterium]|jgi:transmembrane sensor
MKTRHEADDRFEPALSDGEIDELWESLDAVERRQDGRRTVRRALGASVVAAAAIAVVVAAWQLRSPGPLRLRDGGPAVVDGHPIPAAAFPVVFQDGSRLDAVGAASLTVQDNDDRRFTAQLGRGLVRFSVAPGGPRRWVVETDLATVEVIGTVFEVGRDESGLDVRVERGVVLVRGERVPGRLRRLTAGESLSITSLETVADGRVGADTTAAQAATSTVELVPPPLAPKRDAEQPSVPAEARRPRTTAAGAADESLDTLLDALEADRRAGHRPRARARLEERLRTLRPSPERVTLQMTLANWMAEDGDDVAAARLLENVEAGGVPPELVEAAWRAAVSSWNRAGRPREALRVEERLRAAAADTAPSSAARAP